MSEPLAEVVAARLQLDRVQPLIKEIGDLKARRVIAAHQVVLERLCDVLGGMLEPQEEAIDDANLREHNYEVLNKAKELIDDIEAQFDDGAKFTVEGGAKLYDNCPRCGANLDVMNPVMNPISRVEPTYICNNCGTLESLWDAAYPGGAMPGINEPLGTFR